LGGIKWLYLAQKSNNRGEASIKELEKLNSDSIVRDSYKEPIFQGLHGIFQFLNNNVEEGKLYKLVSEKLESDFQYTVRLYEIVDGLSTLPIVTKEIVKVIGDLN
jgi:hypothetical protein